MIYMYMYDMYDAVCMMGILGHFGTKNKHEDLL